MTAPVTGGWVSRSMPPELKPVLTEGDIGLIGEDHAWWQAVTPPGHTLHGWSGRERVQFMTPGLFPRLIVMEGSIAAHIHALLASTAASPLPDERPSSAVPAERQAFPADRRARHG